MFSVERRSRLLMSLTEAARGDDQVVAAALIGSMARRDTDRWSDIDLALRLAPRADVAEVAARWSALMQELGPVADHLDIDADGALYRVFLLSDSLQVDLSFWSFESFASTGGSFDVLFGEANAPPRPAPVDPASFVGWAWLYALHARSALGRGRAWQALQMIDGLRDQLIALACVRHGLPPQQGRGVDRLPDEDRAALAAAVAPAPDGDSLRAAFTAGLQLLLEEVRLLDGGLAERLAPALQLLQASKAPPPS